MAVEKGKEWGRPGTLPPSAPIASGDLEASRMVARGESTIGLEAGDLARTLGIRSPYQRSTPKQLVAVDAISIELDDGSAHVAMAHALLGHPVASRESFAIMNAAFWNGRNIAPRAHPGDGKLDVVRFRMGGAERLQAWRRMTTGSHIPHPAIAISRTRGGRASTKQRRTVWIDGERVGRSSAVRYQLIPEAITIGVS